MKESNSDPIEKKYNTDHDFPKKQIFPTCNINYKNKCKEFDSQCKQHSNYDSVWDNKMDNDYDYDYNYDYKYDYNSRYNNEIDNTALNVNLENQVNSEKTIPIYCINNSNLQINKAAKYIFPKKDFYDSSWDQTKYNDYQLLNGILNLYNDKLQPELLEVWNDLSGRNIFSPEVTENGIHKTSFEISQEAKFYSKTSPLKIQKQSKPFKTKSIAMDLFSPEICQFDEGTGNNFPKLSSPNSQTDTCQSGMKKSNDSTNMRSPHSQTGSINDQILSNLPNTHSQTKILMNKQIPTLGPIINEPNEKISKENSGKQCSIKAVDLYREYTPRDIRKLNSFFDFSYFNLPKVITFIKTNKAKILNYMKDCISKITANKKLIKKLKKYHRILLKENIKSIHFPPISRCVWSLVLNYSLDDAVSNKRKLKLLTTTLQMSLTSELPFLKGVFGQKKEGNKINLENFLIDTGAQASLASMNHLARFGMDRSNIENCENFHIQSTTDLRKNAIIGFIKVDIYVLAENKTKFIKVPNCQILIVDQGMHLDQIIMGANFMKHTRMNLKYNDQDIQCMIDGHLQKELGQSKCVTKYKAAVFSNTQIKDDIIFQNTSSVYNENKTVEMEPNNDLSQTSELYLTGSTKGLSVPRNITINAPLKAFFNSEGEPVLDERCQRVLMPISSKGVFGPKLAEAIYHTHSQTESHSCQKCMISTDWTHEPNKTTTGQVRQTPEARNWDILNQSIFGNILEPKKINSTCIFNNTILSSKKEENKEKKTSGSYPPYKLENYTKLNLNELEKCGIRTQTPDEGLSILRNKIKGLTEETEYIDNTPISEIISKRMDKFDICLEDPGNALKLDHLPSTINNQLQPILEKHQEVFSKGPQDIGKFKYFEVDFEVKSQTGLFEKRRSFKPSTLEALRPKIKEAIDAGIFEEGTVETEKFCTNMTPQPKPSKDFVLFGKADQFLRTREGKQPLPERITLDMRKLNDSLSDTPVISLPCTKDLRTKVKECFASSMDIFSMFNCIPLKLGSRKFTNFYDPCDPSRVLRCKTLPQGSKQSPWLATRALQTCCNEEEYKQYCKEQGETPGKNGIPASLEQVFTKYIDDLLILTSKSAGLRIHLFILSFVFQCLIKAGFKLSKKKTHLLVEDFTFLGIQYSTSENKSMIPKVKQQALSQIRNPASTAELISRLSQLRYYASWIPGFAKISIPLIQMAKSGKFAWTKTCNLAFQQLLFLVKMGFENFTVDKESVLFLSMDSSQVSAGFHLFQIDTMGDIKTIYTGSKALKQSERRMASVHRELNALVWALTECEFMIRGHPIKCIALSDASCLQLLQRSKTFNSKIYDYTLFVSSFTNLEVCFFPGKANYLSDSVTRGFTEMQFKQQSEISQEMSKILPKLSKSHVGQKLNNEELTDFILENPFEELIDVFCKRLYYKPDTDRYGLISNLHSLEEHNKCPTELQFLTSLYCGHNKSDMTQEEFNDIQARIENSPKNSLKRKLKNNTYEKLRDLLFESNLHPRLLNALARRYSLDLTAPVNDEATCHKTVSTPNTTPESTLGRLGGTEIAENINDLIEIKHNGLSNQNMTNYVELQEQDTTCETEGEREALEQVFSSCTVDLNEFGSKIFSATKNLVKVMTDLDQDMGRNSKRNNETDLDFLLRLFIMIRNILQNEQFNILGRNIQLFQYHSKPSNFITRIEQNKIGIYAKEDLIIPSFSTMELDFHFYIYMKQALVFVPIEHTLQINCSMSGYAPYYKMSEVNIDNWENIDICIKKNENIGHLVIANQPDNTYLLGQRKGPEIENNFNNFYQSHNDMKSNNLMTPLSSYLSQYVKKMADVENMSSLENSTKYEERQNTLTLLCQKAGLSPDTINITSQNKSNFENIRSKLNNILLSQRLMKSAVLEQKEIKTLQNSCHVLQKIRQNLIEGQDIQNFIILDDLLYKRTPALNTFVYKLCIPNNVAYGLLHNLHFKENFHVSAGQLSTAFKSSYFTPNLNKIATSIVQSCNSCQVNKALYKKSTRGNVRENRENWLPGEIWTVDCMHLCKSINNFNYAFVFAENITGYVAILPTNAINASSACKAVRALFSILPLCKGLYSDLGPEFSQKFGEYLHSLNISHLGEISRRSPQQSQAELSIKLAKSLLLKTINAGDYSRKHWCSVLPFITMSINSTQNRKSILSRNQMLLSPFFYANPVTNIEDPCNAQLQEFINLNNKRLKQLQRPLNKWDKHDLKLRFRVGQLVYKNNEYKTTENGSKALLPIHADIFQIVKLFKNNFAAIIRNLRTQAEYSVCWNVLVPISFGQLAGLDFNLGRALGKFQPKVGFFKHGNKNKLTLIKNFEQLASQENEEDDEQFEEEHYLTDEGGSNEWPDTSWHAGGANEQQEPFTKQEDPEEDLEKNDETLINITSPENIQRNEYRDDQNNLKRLNNNKRPLINLDYQGGDIPQIYDIKSKKKEPQSAMINKSMQSENNIKHIEDKNDELNSNSENMKYRQLRKRKVLINSVNLYNVHGVQNKIPFSINKIKQGKSILKRSKNDVQDLQSNLISRMSSEELIALKKGLKTYCYLYKKNKQLVNFCKEIINHDFSNNFVKYYFSNQPEQIKSQTTKKVNFEKTYLYWDAINKPEIYVKKIYIDQKPIIKSQANYLLSTIFSCSINELKLSQLSNITF